MTALDLHIDPKSALSNWEKWRNNSVALGGDDELKLLILLVLTIPFSALVSGD